MSATQGTFTIVNEVCTRASAKFVDMVEQFDASQRLKKTVLTPVVTVSWGC